MGYTHYYYQKPKLDKEKFGAFASDCKKIITAAQASGIKLTGWNGEDGSPEATSKKVSFNGFEEESHESFTVLPITAPAEFRSGDTMSFQFCKTACKPYDVAVTACLIALKHHFGDDVKIHSDGDEEDWLEGKQLCQSSCGYGDGATILDGEDD